MGSCFSSNFVDESSTAKIICTDGSLRECSIPTKVSDILGRGSFPSFLCNSDSLCYHERIQAMGPDELVVPGQLYFILPIKMRKQTLSGSDMAALAVEASSALEQILKSKSNRMTVRTRPLGGEYGDNDDENTMINEISVGKKVRKNSSLRYKKSRRSLKLKLSVIEEVESY